jgi:hypothetical protein
MKALNVIIAGECSGTIRDAFAALGHNAWSCDLKPSSSPGGQHYQGSWRDIHWPSFDLLIAHPVCTHLAVSGARHFAEKRADGRQQAAIAEFLFLANAPVAMKAIEQPVSIMSSLYRKPDQIIQPWQFGHGETKATCLWLTGLPKLIPTNIVDGREARIHRMPPSPGRAALRSVTYSGIAEAMALQWGGQVDREELAA